MGVNMTLDEMEMEKRDQRRAGTLTVTHLAIVEDEASGDFVRVPVEMWAPRGVHADRVNPDLHLGAVSD